VSTDHLKNWAGNLTYAAEKVCYPANVEELHDPTQRRAVAQIRLDERPPTQATDKS